MSATRRFMFLTMLAVSLAQSVLTHAQEAEPTQEHHDFSVTSSIGISFSGTQFTTQFKLVDELGLEYDVMSLMRDAGIRESLGLPREQLAEMYQLSSKATTALTAQFTSQLLSDDVKKGLEEQFRNLDTDLRLVLGPEKELLLDQARIQLGIKQYGLAKYLATETMMSKLGLSKDDLKQLTHSDTDSASNQKKRLEELLIEANEALVKNLSDDQQNEFEELLVDSTEAEFMGTQMFFDKKSLKRRASPPVRVLLSLLKRKKIKKELKLEPTQNEEIESLTKTARKMEVPEVEATIDQILTADQNRRLRELAVRSESAKYGTVNSLCYGVLGQSLDLNQEDSDEIYDIGKEIYAELLEDIEQTKSDSLRESLGSLSTAKRNRILEATGIY